MNAVSSAENLVLGIDVGGTKVAAGLVNERGEILHKFRVLMSPSGTAEDGLAAVKAAIEGVLRDNGSLRARLGGIGIISPGPLDPKRGVVINPPNLPCWRDFQLAEEVERAFGIPTRLDNDANAAALAEALWGAGRGYSLVFYATLGTGIGTGIVFDGHIHHGRTGAAAEAGHLTIDYHGPFCGCGTRGCIEALASGPAIAQRARKLVSDTKSGAMLRLAGGEPANITTELVADAYRAGDPVATQVLRDTAEMLGIWLGNMVDVLEPDVLIVGGGVSELMSGFFDYIREVMQKWSINQRCCEIPLVRAYYGADAGIAGAAALCFSGAKESPAPVR